MQAQRRRLRRLVTPALAGLLGLGGAGTGIGLAATPAAAAAPALAVSLVVSTPEAGAAPNTLYVGQPVIYQATITAGSAVAGVVLNDTLPTDLTFSSVDNPAWSCTDTAGALSCGVGSLAANTSSTAKLTFALSAGTVLPFITFNPGATDAAADTSTAVSDTAGILPAADLSITKTLTTPAPNPVYTLTVTNTGPSSSGPITVTDRLSPGLSAPSTSSTDAWLCSTAALPTITCTLAAGLASGSPSTITVSATGTARVTDGASVTGSVFDPNPANNSAPAPQGLVAYGTAADPGLCGPASADVPPVRTCDLVAAAGTVTVPTFASPIPVWGFAIDPNPGTTTVPPAGTIPGPTLVANEGETLRLVVRNALPCLKVTGGVGTIVNYPCPGGLADMNILAVQIPGITTSHTDDTGIPSGAFTAPGDPNYTWAGLQPGTYIYEAGQTANGARQLAMGLEGLLVVRPKTFSPAAPTLFDPPAGAAPLHGAAPSGATTTTSTTAAPVTTTTAAPVTSTTATPATTTAPGTTAAPAVTSTTTASRAAAAAVTSTTGAPATTTAPSETTTTGAPTTTTAPAVTTTTSTPTTTTTTAPPGPNGASPLATASLLGAGAPSACANPSAGSGFTAEALVQVNELSSQFHANPFSSVMTPGGGNDPINTLSQHGSGGSADVATYAPDVFLINGKAYPGTDPVSVTATDCVALHFANFGMLEKSFGVLDQRETVMADDSVALANPQNVATRYLNPGEEFDAAVDMTGSAAGQQFPVMDFEHHLHNGAGTANNATAANATGMTLGGQLTLLQVDGPDPAGAKPVIDAVGLDHTTVAVDGGGTPTPGSLLLTAGAFETPAAALTPTITGARYGVDSTTGPWTAAPGMTGSGYSIPAPTLQALHLANGDHAIWAEVQDSTGIWSAPAGVVFTYDEISGPGPTPGLTKCPDSPNPLGGPIVCNFSLDPTVTNGSTPNKTPGPTDPATGVPTVSSDMVIDGTAMPPLPDWAIDHFTWQIDSIATPTSVPITCAGGPCNAGQTAELTTTIPTATLAALSQGPHTVTITATETQGANMRTGNAVTLTFTMDTSGPTATIDSLDPNPAGPGSDNLSNLNYFPSVIIRGSLAPPLADVTVTGGEMIFAPVCPPSATYRGAACTPGSGVFLDPSLSDTSPTADGTGVQLVPSGGVWNQPAGAPAGYNVEIPTGEFNGIPQGLVRVYVHGQDQSGQWGPWTHTDLVLDKTPPTVSGAAVTSSAGHYMLNFTAQDPPTVPACNNPPVNTLPNGCGGIVEQSGVAAVEWQISYADVIDNVGQNDFTVFRPKPYANGPEAIALDVTGGPQPYPASFQVVFRVMDGAGNWTAWNTVSYP